MATWVEFARGEHGFAGPPLVCATAGDVSTIGLMASRLDTIPFIPNDALTLLQAKADPHIQQSHGSMAKNVS